MSGFEPRPGEYVRSATWMPVPDRRQAQDRRAGGSRGGRRITDQPVDPNEPAAWMTARGEGRPRQTPVIWLAAARFRRALRQIGAQGL